MLGDASGVREVRGERGESDGAAAGRTRHRAKLRRGRRAEGGPVAPKPLSAIVAKLTCRARRPPPAAASTAPPTPGPPRLRQRRLRHELLPAPRLRHVVQRHHLELKRERRTAVAARVLLPFAPCGELSRALFIRLLLSPLRAACELLVRAPEHGLRDGACEVELGYLEGRRRRQVAERFEAAAGRLIGHAVRRQLEDGGADLRRHARPAPILVEEHARRRVWNASCPSAACAPPPAFLGAVFDALGGALTRRRDAHSRGRALNRACVAGVPPAPMSLRSASAHAARRLCTSVSAASSHTRSSSSAMSAGAPARLAEQHRLVRLARAPGSSQPAACSREERPLRYAGVLCPTPRRRRRCCCHRLWRRLRRPLRRPPAPHVAATAAASSLASRRASAIFESCASANWS